MHRSRLAGFIIDCKTDDLDAATLFWRQALGMNALERDPNGYDRLDSSARDLQIEVQRVTHESFACTSTSRRTTSTPRSRGSRRSKRGAWGR